MYRKHPTVSDKTSDLHAYDTLIQRCEKLLKQNFTIYYDYVKQQEVLRLEFLGTSTDYKYLRTWLDIAYEDILTSKSKHGTLTQHYEVLLKNNIITKFLDYANDHETLQFKFIETIHQCNDIKTNLDASNEYIKSLKSEYGNSCQPEKRFLKIRKTLRSKLVESITECERVKKSLDEVQENIIMLNSEHNRLTRRFRILFRENITKEFLEYAKYQEKLELKFIEKTNENECSKSCLDQANNEIASLNSKLTEIREMLNRERLLKEKMYKERDSLDYLSGELCCLLFKYQRRAISNDTKENCSMIDETMLKSANIGCTSESSSTIIGFGSSSIPEISNSEVKIEKKEINCDKFEVNNSESMMKEEKTDLNRLVNTELEVPFSDEDCFSSDKLSTEISQNSNEGNHVLPVDKILDHSESCDLGVVESLEERSNNQISQIPDLEEEAISMNNENEIMQDLVNLQKNQLVSILHCDIFYRDYLSMCKPKENERLKLFKCNDCCHMFAGEDAMRRHLSQVHKLVENYYDCADCDKRYFSRRGLTHHIFSKHSENYDKSYKCTDCDASFSVEFLLTRHKAAKHDSLETSVLHCDIFCQDYFDMCELNENNSTSCERLKLFKCNDCCQMFTGGGAMRRHISRVHELVKNYYDCAACDERYDSRRRLIQHIFTKHSENYDKSYKCTDCDASFSVKFLLTRHKVAKHDSVETLGEKIVEKVIDCDNVEENKNEQTMAQEKEADMNHVVNSELELSFSDKENNSNISNNNESSSETLPHSNKKNDTLPLVRISRLEHSESPEPIQRSDHSCDRISDHEEEIASSSISTEVVPDSVANLLTKQIVPNLRCDIFCADYPSMCELKEHNCIACERLKLFKCKDCGQMFSREDALQDHISQVHEFVENYYECVHCQKRYVRRGGLIVHIYTKHSEKFRKSYKCTICDASFVAKFLLNRHKNEKHYSAETSGGKINEKDISCDDFGENKNKQTISEEKRTDENRVVSPELELRFSNTDNYSNLSNSDKTSSEKLQTPNKKSDTLPLVRILRLDHSGSSEPIQKSHAFRTTILKSPDDHSCDRISDHDEETMSMGSTDEVEFNSVANSRIKQPVSNLRCDIFCRDYPSMCELKEYNCIACERLKLFKCNDCGQMFAREDAMQDHISQVHEPVENYYECAYCQNRYTLRGGLLVHLYTKHPEKYDKSYKCTTCDASFVAKFLLNIHKNETHPSAETPGLNCDICDRHFVKKRSLKSHKVSVHRKKRFACTECGKMFTCLSFLKIHSFVHSSEKHFKCSTCDQRFKSYGGRKKHEDVHSGDIRFFSCAHCNQHYRSKYNLSIHIHEQHFGKKKSRSFKCATCDKSFNYKEHLKKHLSTHSSEKPFKCSICESRFRQKGNKNQHEQLVHHRELPFGCAHCDNRYVSKDSLKNHIHKRHFSGLIKSFKCTTCGSAFTSISILRNHVRVVHSWNKLVKCSFCDQYFKHDLYKKRHEQKIHPPNTSFRCLQCGRHFEDEKNLSRHMQRFHASEPVKKPFECPICNKKFASEITLEKHKSTHSKQNDTSFNCAHCDKVYYRKNAIAKHIQEIHLPRIKKLFKCTICRKSFGAKRNLDRHQVVHITERRYKCSTCEKRFKSHECKRLHEMRNHGERDDFICAYCDKKFRDKPSVSGHIHRNHLPRNNKRFKCNVCKKSFPFREYLRTHQRSHTTKRSYKCSKCDKCYKTASTRRVHELAAHEGRRFKCQRCGKVFVTAAAKRTHERTVHRNLRYNCRRCYMKFSSKTKLSTHIQNHHS